MSATTAAITLTEPSTAIRIWVARAYLAASGPDRVGLEALALALAWPAPPWEADAAAALTDAQREARESAAYAKLSTLSAEERAEAVADARRARLAVAEADARLAALRPALTSPSAAAAWAMAQMEAAGVPSSTWGRVGDQLLARWLDLVIPPVGDVAGAVDFSLPPVAQVSGGGSNSPVNGVATH